MSSNPKRKPLINPQRSTRTFVFDKENTVPVSLDEIKDGKSKTITFTLSGTVVTVFSKDNKLIIESAKGKNGK